MTMENILAKTLFLAKQLDDFEGFKTPGKDYEIIACRASDRLIIKYPDIMVYELISGERTYSTQSNFKKIFKDFNSYSNRIDFENLWTYQAYPWTDDFKTAGVKVFCIDYLMFLRLQNKLNQRKLFLTKASNPEGKYIELYNNLVKSNSILKTKVIKRFSMSYEELKAFYMKDFVICDSYSDGGEGVYRISNRNEFNNAFSQIKSPVIRTELFIQQSTPVNQIGAVSSGGQIVKYKPSIQIIKNIHQNNKMEYAGCDFNSEVHMKNGRMALESITELTHQIGKILFEIGYRGVFGCDYIVHGNDVHFIEINPRYQASTFILTRSLGNDPLLSPHIQHIYGFLHPDEATRSSLKLYDEPKYFIDLTDKNSPRGYLKIFEGSHNNMFHPRSDIKIEEGLEKGYILFKDSIIESTYFPTSVKSSSCAFS